MQEHRWAIATLGIVALLVVGGVVFKIRTTPEAPPPLPPEPLLDRPPVNITDPQRGPSNAPLTVVYYADFGCDSCASVWPTIEALEKDAQFKNSVRFVWKDYPTHEGAFPEIVQLHRAGRCAAAAGKFWEYQAAVFSHVLDVRARTPVLQRALQESGLNPAALSACLNGSGAQSLVDASVREGQRLNITVTPTVFILETNKRFDGIPPYHVLAGNLRNALAQIQAGRQMMPAR